MSLNTGEKVLLGGVAAFVGLVVLQKITALKNLVFSPGGIVGIRFDGATPVLSIIVNIDNTSSASIAVNGFSGNVYANDTFVGTITNFYPIVIAAGQRTPLQVDIAFQILGITNNIINAFSYGNGTEELHIVGAANVLGQQWPIDIKQTVGAK